MTSNTGKEYILFNFFNDFLRVGQKIEKKDCFQNNRGHTAKCYWSGDVIFHNIRFSVQGIANQNKWGITKIDIFLQSKRFMCAPNFEVSCPAFEYRMRRFGNSLQRFAPNVPTFRQNVRANLTIFIQDLFWRVRFSRL